MLNRTNQLPTVAPAPASIGRAEFQASVLHAAKSLLEINSLTSNKYALVHAEDLRRILEQISQPNTNGRDKLNLLMPMLQDMFSSHRAVKKLPEVFKYINNIMVGLSDYTQRLGLGKLSDFISLFDSPENSAASVIQRENEKSFRVSMKDFFLDLLRT